MNSKISESIFANGKILIPMADVQHIEKLTHSGKPNGILVITKYTVWNFEMDMWDNAIYLGEEECSDFISAWCRYRYKVDIKTR